VDSSDANDTAGTLPAWVVPLVLLALAAGGATYLLRRRHRTSP
jgi:cytochrome c-type biogenesis protein CcmH/NrfF